MTRAGKATIIHDTAEDRASSLAPVSRTTGVSKALAVLVVAAVATLGVDRIDFFGGSGPFGLTPFLVLAPFSVIAALLLSRGARPTWRFTMSRLGAALLVAFLVLVFVSTLFASSSLSFKRAVLVAVLIGGTWALVVVIRRTGAYDMARLGAWIGLGLYVAFDIWQYFYYAAFGENGESFIGIVNAHLVPYGADLVRGSGGSLDPNRACLAVATYVFILIGDPRIRRVTSLWRSLTAFWIGAVLVLLTFSRSGLAAFLIALVGAAFVVLQRESVRRRIAILGSAVAAVGVIVLIVLAYAAWGPFGARSEAGSAPAVDSSGVIASRLDLTSGSAKDHFELVGIGLKLLHAQAQQPLLGLGQGESYRYLQDFFPGNDYANLHSLYLTIGVEVGLIALLLVLGLLVAPLLGGRGWLALATIVFGINYQASSDPVFWFQIALLWFIGGSFLLPRVADFFNRRPSGGAAVPSPEVSTHGSA